MAQQQGQSNLTSIFSYSLPGNHLLQISLVKQATADDSYKKQHFFFITLAPGAQTAEGGRTFNFQNKITMKQEIHQIYGLASGLISSANNAEANIGKYSAYSDASKSAFGGAGAGGKSLGVQRAADQKGNVNVVMYFKTGSNQPLGFGMNPHIAVALARICNKMADKAMDLEMERVQGAAYGTTTNTAFGTPPGNPPGTPPTGNTPSNVVNNFAGAFENGFADEIPPF